MGFTKSTYTQTVHKIVGDGQGGYWTVSRDVGDTYPYKFQYFQDGNGTTEQTSPIDAFDTFADVINWMIAGLKVLPPIDLGAQVDRLGNKAGILPEFRGPAISNATLAIIALTYDPILFSNYLGAFTIARRFYVRGHITWSDLSGIYIYLRINKKIARGRVETSMTWLVNNGHITAAQETQFWLDWAAQVGA